MPSFAEGWYVAGFKQSPRRITSPRRGDQLNESCLQIPQRERGQSLAAGEP